MMDYWEIIKIAALALAVVVIAKFLDEFLVGKMRARQEKKKQDRSDQSGR